VAEHLEALIVTLNDRHRMREERSAQAAQAAMSMKLLTWLPLACGAWIFADSASVRSFLFGSVLGWACLTIGIGLNLCGRWWLRREVSAC
jgi:Flp pilus assembly protein TadB